LTVIFITTDGKKVSREPIAPTVAASGANAIVVTFNDLKRIDYVLQVNLNTSPVTYATPHNIAISDNNVGMTVYVGAGTTLSGEIIAIGSV